MLLILRQIDHGVSGVPSQLSSAQCVGRTVIEQPLFLGHPAAAAAAALGAIL